MFADLKKNVFATPMSSIKWNGDGIVYPDIDTIDVWNKRISILLKSGRNSLMERISYQKYQDVTRIPIPDASLATVVNAMNPIFFSERIIKTLNNQPIELGDPFYWIAIEHYFKSKNSNIYNPTADSNSLQNIPQIFNCMILVNPKQFESFTIGFNDETLLYRKIARFPAIDSISDTRALLALWSGEPELLEDPHLDVAMALSVGTFGDVYPPKRFKYLLECIKRTIEPWEGYLGIVSHGWSALVIRNKLVTTGSDELGAH